MSSRHGFGARASWLHRSTRRIRSLPLLFFAGLTPGNEGHNKPAGLSSILLPMLSIFYYLHYNVYPLPHMQTGGVYRIGHIARWVTSTASGYNNFHLPLSSGCQ